MANFSEQFAIFFKADTKQAGAGIDKLLGLFDKTGDKVKVLKAQMNKLGLEFDSTGDDALDLAKNYDKLMKTMQTSTKPSLQELNILSMNLSELGNKITGINTAVIGQAAELQQKMANIKATVGGAINADGLDMLEKQIRAASINIGEDADLLAEKVTDALSAGASQDFVAQQIELAGKAARGTRGDLNTMVDLGNAVRNTFGEAAGGVENIYDLVSRTYQLGDITGSEIAQGFGFVGGTAKEAGIEINDLFSAIAVGSKKVRPEQLFTGMNAAISELNTTNSKAEKALQSLGYENLQAALETESFVDIANKLNASGIKMNDIFGRQAARAIQAIGGDMENSAEIAGQFNDVTEATNQIFADATDTLKFYQDQQKALRGELNQTIGESMIPMTMTWTQVQNDLLQRLIDTPPALKAIIGTSLQVGSGLGKVASFAGEASKNFVAVKEAGSALKALKLGEYFGKVSKAMENVNVKGVNLKQIIGGAGLAAAIAFTTGQIIKLVGAINDYSDALDSLEETRANLLQQTEQLAKDKSEEERYALAASELQRYIDLVENAPSTFDKLNRGLIEGSAIHKQYKADLEDSKNQLAALGITITENTDLEAELTKALEAKAEIHERIGKQQALLDKQNKDEIANKKEQIPLTEEQIKWLAEFEKVANQVAEQVKEGNREAQLADLEGTREYFAKRREYLQQDQQALVDALSKRFGTHEDFGWLIADLERQMDLELRKIDAEQAAWEEENRLARMEKEESDLERMNQIRAEKQAKQLEQAQTFYRTIDEIAGESARLFGENMAQGVKDQKAVLKALLTNLVSYVEKQVMLALPAASASSIITGGLNAGLVVQALGLKAGFAAVKSAIASFDEGGIPTSDGLAMMHKTDVTVNPTTENPMMTALTNRLAEAVGGRSQKVVMTLDGEVLGEANISYVNRRNRQLGKGKSVFQESINN